MSILEKVVDLSIRVHSGQKDTAEKPYIIRILKEVLKKKTEQEIIKELLDSISVSLQIKLTEVKVATEYKQLTSQFPIEKMTRLEKAILLSLKHHKGQKDKGGTAYILHPLRVMLGLETESEMIVGVLHDIIEDTGVTLEELMKIGVTEEELFALHCLTRLEGETYDEFIYRVLQSGLAVRVKKKDIKENLDISRIPDMDVKKFSLKKRYDRALEILEGAGIDWYYGPAATSEGKCSWFKVVATKKPDVTLYKI